MLLQEDRKGRVISSDLRRPEVKLTDYNHQEIPVMALVELELFLNGGPTVKVPVLVSAKAESSCLLGLETILELGLVSLAPEVEVRQATEGFAGKVKQAN